MTSDADRAPRFDTQMFLKQALENFAEEKPKEEEREGGSKMTMEQATKLAKDLLKTKNTTKIKKSQT